MTEDEIKEQEKLMIAVRAHTLFDPTTLPTTPDLNKDLMHLVIRLTTASQYIHPQNPDYVVPMEPKFVVPQWNLIKAHGLSNEALATHICTYIWCSVGKWMCMHF